MSNSENVPTILVIDDDPLWLKLTTNSLQKSIPSRILTAGFVQEALSIVAGETANGRFVDLVVLDMHMPLGRGAEPVSSTAGIEFLYGLKLVTCPVIVLTAYPSYDNCVAAAKAGGHTYIPKDKADMDRYSEEEEPLVKLVRVSKGLLASASGEQSQSVPSSDWMAANSDWLRERFGEQWVVLLDKRHTDVQKMAYDAEDSRDGIVVLHARSREELHSEIMRYPAELKTMPPVVKVVGTKNQETDI